jgi:flagellar biogenesis protein FliO
MPGNGAAGASYGDLLVTSLVVLGAVCVAAFVVVRLAGRLLATGRARGAHLLDVIARLPLEPRRSLYVVEVAGKTLLVGTSEMGLSVLTELDREEVRSRAVERPSFGELVRQAWLRRAAARPPPQAGPSPSPTPGAGEPPGASPAAGDGDQLTGTAADEHRDVTR